MSKILSYLTFIVIMMLVFFASMAIASYPKYEEGIIGFFMIIALYGGYFILIEAWPELGRRASGEAFINYCFYFQFAIGLITVFGLLTEPSMYTRSIYVENGMEVKIKIVPYLISGAWLLLPLPVKKFIDYCRNYSVFP